MDDTLDWDEHADEIRRLLVSQNMKLSEVMEHMKEAHHFEASERQYKYRFSNLKNVRADEWTWIGHEIQQRAAQGKKSEVCLFNNPLPEDRVIRGTTRNKNATSNVAVSDDFPNPSPKRIKVRTPDPHILESVTTPSSLDLNLAEMSNRGVSGEEQSEWALAIDAMALETEISPQLCTRQLTGFEMEMEHTTGAADGGFPSNYETGIFVAETATSYTIQPFRNTLSPISQLFTFEISDIHPQDRLMANLPWFQLRTIMEQPDAMVFVSNPNNIFHAPSQSNSSLILPTENQVALRQLLGSISDDTSTVGAVTTTNLLQRSVPARYEGDISNQLSQIFETSSTGATGLAAVFGLAAYFASNNKLPDHRMDLFLNWVIDQRYLGFLEGFLQVNTPTIHEFANHVLKSAMRVKSTELLASLMERGIKMDSLLCNLLDTGDMELFQKALWLANPLFFKGPMAGQLFHDLVFRKHFAIAHYLVRQGVNANCMFKSQTALNIAVKRNDAEMARFLLRIGASVESTSLRYNAETITPLAQAALNDNLTMTTILLEHDAQTTCCVEGLKILDWTSIHRRKIYKLLTEHLGHAYTKVGLCDVIEAAHKDRHGFKGYVERHQDELSNQTLEQALDVLIEGGMVLELVVRKRDFELLERFIEAGIDLKSQGMQALAVAAEEGSIPQVALLLHHGVDIETPGIRTNPLQLAAQEGDLAMLDFLLDRGADINAPAGLNEGLTALQASLQSENAHIALHLLGRGADIMAPPALVKGLTPLEALCHNYSDFKSDLLSLCNQLLDAGAQVNRPNGKASSALHGAIERRWPAILSRMLEPHHNTIANLMWYDEMMEESDDIVEPRTPTQLAASMGNMEMVKLLLDSGADVNEAPAFRFGRTALQAATSTNEPDMELVEFLLEKGADVNGAPAVEGGITALQGAAISGDIMLAKLLLERGANVNAAPSLREGRYAIEGAAEHGRLDMVQLLLNAGALGNTQDGTGFAFALKLAEQRERFAIAGILKDKMKGFVQGENST